MWIHVQHPISVVDSHLKLSVAPSTHSQEACQPSGLPTLLSWKYKNLSLSFWHLLNYSYPLAHAEVCFPQWVPEIVKGATPYD